MSNIKGLYFKLNMDKRPDKDIYNFFIQETKRTGQSKIELLTCMMACYRSKYLEEILKHGKTHAAVGGNKK